MRVYDLRFAGNTIKATVHHNPDSSENKLKTKVYSTSCNFIERITLKEWESVISSEVVYADPNL